MLSPFYWNLIQNLAIHFKLKFSKIWQPENTKKFTILKKVFTMKRKRLDSIQITQPQKDLDTMYNPFSKSGNFK
jgi:hypothetical protein